MLVETKSVSVGSPSIDIDPTVMTKMIDDEEKPAQSLEEERGGGGGFCMSKLLAPAGDGLHAENKKTGNYRKVSIVPMLLLILVFGLSLSRKVNVDDSNPLLQDVATEATGSGQLILDVVELVDAKDTVRRLDTETDIDEDLDPKLGNEQRKKRRQRRNNRASKRPLVRIPRGKIMQALQAPKENGANWKVLVNTNTLRRPNGMPFRTPSTDLLLDVDGTNVIEYVVEEKDGKQALDITGAILYSPTKDLTYEITTACVDGESQCDVFFPYHLNPESEDSIAEDGSERDLQTSELVECQTDSDCVEKWDVCEQQFADDTTKRCLFGFRNCEYYPDYPVLEIYDFGSRDQGWYSRCVECTTDDHCGGDEPYCHPNKKQCRACLTDDHCSSSTPYCLGAGQCYECISQSDCPQDDAYICNCRNQCSIGSCDNCFSGENTVNVKDRGAIQISDLQVGDYVETANDEFSLVYSLGHIQHEKETEYLRMETTGKNWIEISNEHLLLVNGKHVKASKAVIGDKLTTAALEQEAITKISTVTRRGLYAPKTVSGHLSVSGLQASSYSLVGSISEDILTQNILHAIFAPLRLFCQSKTGSSALCDQYDDRGFNVLYGPLVGIGRFLGFSVNGFASWFLTVTLVILLSPLLLMFYVWERLGHQNFLVSVVAVAYSCYYWRRICKNCGGNETKQKTSLKYE